MLRLAAILVFAASLVGCDAVNTLTDGFKYAKAVEADLEASTGVKPAVGFNWSNGRLMLVTVSYPHLIEGRPIGTLAETVRTTVGRQFRQTPDNIVLAFSLGKGG